MEMQAPMPSTLHAVTQKPLRCDANSTWRRLGSMRASRRATAAMFRSAADVELSTRIGRVEQPGLSALERVANRWHSVFGMPRRITRFRVVKIPATRNSSTITSTDIVPDRLRLRRR